MTEFDAVLFSDLHLADGTTKLNALFDAFVDRVKGTPEVACLGDLTEYWIGKGHLNCEFGRFLSERMARLAKPAKRAIWVNGNRDFRFAPHARKIGYQAFRNRYEGEFAGRQVSLDHGDLFCTKDCEYQRFRLWFRNFPWWAIEPLITDNAAHRLCQFFRGKSKGEGARRDPDYYGIQPEPVERLVNRGAEVIVCGHVHTPFSRDYQTGGGSGRLLVMSDWREDAAVVCVVKDGEFKLVKFDGDDFVDFKPPTKQGTYSLELAGATD